METQPLKQVSSYSSRVTQKVIGTLNREGANLRESSTFGEVLDESLRRGRDITELIIKACGKAAREEMMQEYLKEDAYGHVADEKKNLQDRECSQPKLTLFKGGKRNVQT